MKTVNGVEKPLAEWTLKDIKEYCKLSNTYIQIGKQNDICTGCKLYSICNYYPIKWSLVEKPKFTQQEIEDARVLNRILVGGLQSIARSIGGESVTASFNCTPLSCSYLSLSKKYFKSIENGKCYKLYEIIGDADA